MSNKKITIFGNRWEPIRKWLYPSWIFYELSIRFYEYAISIQSYLVGRHNLLAVYLGDIEMKTLALTFSLSTFIISTFFLTLPSCYVLYYFFKRENLTSTSFEIKLKKYF